MLVRYLAYLHWLRKNLHVDQSELKKAQFKRLKALIRYACDNVAFYHHKFENAGLRPDDIRSVTDLPKVPLTTRKEIQESPWRDLVARNVDLNKCVKSSTSGSTGVPVTVFHDAQTEDLIRALWTRAYLANGWRITDRMAYVWNPLFFRKRSGVFKLLPLKNISVFDDVGRQLESLKRYRPDVIRGYPSCLSSLAAANRESDSCLKPRLVFTGAELLDPRERLEISSSFDCDVLDYFGCGEFSLLMWECTEHTGYHMNVESTIMEFQNEGEVVSSGEEGELVCTSLQNYAMPLIRYELGDVGLPIRDDCSCGRTLPLVKVLRGRSDDKLRTLDGKFVHASPFFHNLFSLMDGIRQFRVIREKSESVVIQLATKKDFMIDDTILDTARIEIQRVLGKNMNVEFQFVDEIMRDPTGKLRVFISRTE